MCNAHRHLQSEMSAPACRTPLKSSRHALAPRIRRIKHVAVRYVETVRFFVILRNGFANMRWAGRRLAGAMVLVVQAAQSGAFAPGAGRWPCLPAEFLRARLGVGVHRRRHLSLGMVAAGEGNYTHSTMQVTGKGAAWDEFRRDTRIVKVLCGVAVGKPSGGCLCCSSILRSVHREADVSGIP